MSFQSFPKFRPDLDDYLGEHTQVLAGVLPRGDGWGPAKTLAAYSQGLGARCRGYFHARNVSDGSITVFAATINRIYRLDNTTLAWTDVSKGGVAYTDLPTGDHWVFVQYGATVVACQGNSVPQKFVVGTSSAFADLGGSPPAARFIATVGRFLVLSGITANRRRVQWCDLDGIETWTAGTGFANFFDAPDGGGVLGQAGGEFGLIFQEEVIRKMTYSPGASPAFQIERVTEQKGLLGAYAVVRQGNRVFFLTQQGFQMYQPGVGLIPIGKEQVDRTILADLDTNNLGMLIGAADPNGSKAYWAYKSVRSSVTTSFDTIISYDFELERWSPPLAISGEYLAALVKPGMTLEGTTAISTNIENIPGSFDDIQASLSADVTAMDAAHKLAFFSGPALEAVLETPEIDLEGSRAIVSNIRPRCDAPTLYARLRHRRHDGESVYQQTAEVARNALGNCPIRRDVKLARVQVRIPAGTAWTYARGVTVDFKHTGQR